MAALMVVPVSLLTGAEKSRTVPVRFLLKNGDSISGTIVEEDKLSVTLHSPVFGEITLPRASIVPEAKTVAPVPPAPASPTTPDPSQAIAKTNAEPPPQGVAPSTTKPWRTKLEFGLNHEDGVKETVRYNLFAQSEKTIGRHNLRATGRLTYSKQDRKATTDRTEAGFRWRQSFPNKTFTQTQTTYYRDQVSGIDTNIDQNAGIGYGLFETPRLDFNVGIGLTGQYREADNLEDNTGALAEFFQDQTLKLNDSTKLVQSLNVQYWPNSPLVATTARDEENLKWRFSTALIGKLSESMSLNLRYEYSYDNAIANRDARANQRITSSLGYLF